MRVMTKVILSNAELDVVNEYLDVLKTPPSINREDKIIRSALLPVAKKLLNKRMNQSGLDTKFRISFKPYEAHYLELFLRSKTPEDIYQKNVILKITSRINQQLA